MDVLQKIADHAPEWVVRLSKLGALIAQRQKELPVEYDTFRQQLACDIATHGALRWRELVLESLGAPNSLLVSSAPLTQPHLPDSSMTEGNGGIEALGRGRFSPPAVYSATDSVTAIVAPDIPMLAAPASELAEVEVPAIMPELSPQALQPDAGCPSLVAARLASPFPLPAPSAPSPPPSTPAADTAGTDAATHATAETTATAATTAAMDTKPRDKTTADALTPANPGQVWPRPLAPAKRKAQTNSLVANLDDNPGPALNRHRTKAVVYYDPNVSAFFEELVTFVSSAGHMMRRARMAAKISRLKRLSDSRRLTDDNEPDMDAQAFIESDAMPNSRYCRSSRSSIGPSESTGKDHFAMLDEHLDKVHASAEKATHQFLTNGECDSEISVISDHLKAAHKIAIAELPRVHAEAVKEVAKSDSLNPRTRRLCSMRRELLELTAKQLDGPRIFTAPGVNLHPLQAESVDEAATDPEGEVAERVIHNVGNVDLTPEDASLHGPEATG